MSRLPIRRKDISGMLDRRWCKIVVGAVQRSNRDRISTSAASLGFHYFIAIVPTAIALVGVANLAGLSQSRLKSITHGISVLLPSATAKVFDQALNKPPSGGSSVLAVTIGLVVAIWAGIEASCSLQVGMDMAYEVDTDRNLVRRRIRGLGLLAITILLGGGAFALLIIGAPLGALIRPAHSSWFPVVWTTTRWVLGIAFGFVLIGLFNYLGPNRNERRWRLLSGGSAFTVALWLAISALYSFYLNDLSRANETYGTFTGVVALLIWLFLSALAVLFGAELDRELEAPSR